MINLATVKQSRLLDLRSEDYGLSPEILMESAGSLSAREIIKNFFPDFLQNQANDFKNKWAIKKRGVEPSSLNPLWDQVSVLCGPGHNGADGAVVARHLLSAGFGNVQVFLLETENPLPPLLKKQLNRLKKLGVSIMALKNVSSMETLKPSSLIVDALFGTACRPCTGRVGEILDFVNSLKTRVVSLDSPSGLDCDRGVFEGASVKAHTTFTFGLAKPGFFMAQGAEQRGNLFVLPIGFPSHLVREICNTHFLFDKKSAFLHLPERGNQSHKADHGRLLVCCGSPGTWGAGVLCSSAAYRMGAGYVLWASETEPFQFLSEIPEVMTLTLDKALSSLDKISAVAFGCGLGVNEKTAQALKKLKDSGCERVVVDADGITTAVRFGLFPFPKTWVITPHGGELSRLIGWSSSEIEKDRINAVLKGSEKAGCHVLLKGYGSVLSCGPAGLEGENHSTENQPVAESVAGGGKVLIVNSGNPALAVAGTGDVLTGMIGALLAQKLDPVPAVATAVYFHGLLADRWVQSGKHPNSFSASDLLDGLTHLPGDSP